MPPQRRSPGLERKTAPIPDDLAPHGELDPAVESPHRVSLLIYHDNGVEMILLAPGRSLVIGRDDPADVRIADLTLSREHARFTLSGGRVTVDDLDSTNGTRIGGVRITRAAVSPGDAVKLGAIVVCVHVLGPAESDLGLESDERFHERLAEEVVRAHHFDARFAVLVVRPERPGVHVRRWLADLRAALPPVARLSLYSADAVQLVLPQAGEAEAAALAAAITEGSAAAGEPLLVGVAVYPEAATSAEKLLELARHAARAAHPGEPVQVVPMTRWVAGAERGREHGGGVLEGPLIHELFETIERVARSRIPVLLHGETGTGKEVAARLIHERGPRRGKPMVCVNCGAISSQLVESFLFGHEKGAFTGAVQLQRGVFEEADGGTVLFDEIGELPPAAQAALLRVLETRVVCRVGSTREIPVDVRILAATHRDLEAMVEQGSFRANLLFRMNTMTLALPPLRERVDEIAPLAIRFLRDANEANQGSVTGIAPAAMAVLERHTWPGNIRELRNAIERAVVVSRNDVIREHDLPPRVRTPAAAKNPSVAPPDPRDTLTEQGPARLPRGPDLKTRLQDYETQLILSTLRETGGNQTEAAHRLGMPLRTLVHKLRALKQKG